MKELKDDNLNEVTGGLHPFSCAKPSANPKFACMQDVLYKGKVYTIFDRNKVNNEFLYSLMDKETSEKILNVKESKLTLVDGALDMNEVGSYK